MAELALKVYVTVSHQDIRDNTRSRQVQVPDLAAASIIAFEMNGASKSKVASWTNSLKLTEDTMAAPDADSEVKDTLRLYFELPNLDRAHFDIVDPHDEVFLALTGAGANILKERADLLLIAGAGTSVDAIIAHVLSGEILISDSETPSRYLSGARV